MIEIAPAKAMPVLIPPEGDSVMVVEPAKLIPVDSAPVGVIAIEMFPAKAIAVPPPPTEGTYFPFGYRYTLGLGRGIGMFGMAYPISSKQTDPPRVIASAGLASNLKHRMSEYETIICSSGA